MGIKYLKYFVLDTCGSIVMHARSSRKGLILSPTVLERVRSTQSDFSSYLFTSIVQMIFERVGKQGVLLLYIDLETLNI